MGMWTNTHCFDFQIFWGGGTTGMAYLYYIILFIQDHIYLYLYRRVCVCLCVYPSKHIYVAVCGPIGTKFGTHMQIHLEKVVGKIQNCPV